MNYDNPFGDFTAVECAAFHDRILDDMRGCGDEIARRVGDCSVLDYGCGPGIDAERYRPDQYTGIDASAPLVEEARRRHPAHQFECRHGRPLLDVRARGVQCVMFKGVIEHQANASDALWLIADAARMAVDHVFIAWHTPPGETETIGRVTGASGREFYQSVFALADFEHVCRTVTTIGVYELWEITP